MLGSLDPLSVIVHLRNHRVTHLAEKCPQMRHKISPHHINPLKKKLLKPHDYEFDIPGTDASPGWAAGPAGPPRKPSPVPRQQGRNREEIDLGHRFDTDEHR